MLQLVQEHTIEIYNLAQKEYTIEVVNARELLHVSRFDLFAKLYYARNRESNYDDALTVYKQHILAFNPDLKEPGREDKNSIDDFVNTFDELLYQFKKQEFDDTVSLVPIDEEGIILDGAHRVAALAYYDKKVTVLHFKNVHSKGPFDYKYFKDRGLSWHIADLIAREITIWRKDMLIACLWPGLGDIRRKNECVEMLARSYKVCYIKDINLSLKDLRLLISKVYVGQLWVNNKDAVFDKAILCYGNSNKTMRIVLLQSNVPLEETIANKERIRRCFHKGKHSIHITDNSEETQRLASLVLSKNGLNVWHSENEIVEIVENIKERWFYFKKVRLIKIKVSLAKIFML